MFLNSSAATPSVPANRETISKRPTRPTSERPHARASASHNATAFSRASEHPQPQSAAPERAATRNTAAPRAHARAPVQERLPSRVSDPVDTGEPTSRGRPQPRPTVSEPNYAPAPEREPFAALGIELGFLWRRKAWITGSVIAALTLSVIFNILTGPRYRAVAQILISPVDLRVLDKALTQPSQTADANVIQVESETRVLTSDKVLRRVVDSERLTTDPEFGGSGLSRWSELVSSLRSAIGLEPSAQNQTDELGAMRILQRSVTAKRTERTYVVDLIVDTNNAEKSARIANAITQAYLQEQTDSRTDQARRVTDSLSSRLAELKERVRRAEEAVELYKSENNIVGASGRLLHEQQLTDLTNQLSAAQGRTAEARARYEQTLQQQRSGINAGSASEAVQSNTIGRLREQFANTARHQATLMAELGNRHPYVIEAQAQVRNAQKLIAEEVARVAEANRIDYERAQANESTLSRSLQALKQNAVDTSMAFVKLRELEREVDASRAVYESFLVRARETREQERLDSANVRILSEAQPPRDRFWPPRLLLMLLAGLLVGILAGSGLAYAAERLRQTRTAAVNR